MTDADRERLDQLEAELLELKLSTLRKDVDDHEKRIRPLEDMMSKFNLLLSLTLGGGILSLINLLFMLFGPRQ